jgi:hypothetical protein
MGTGMVRAAAAASIAFLAIARGPEAEAPLAPAFPTGVGAAWIGKPVSWKDLAGRVVLLDVWTFG